MAGLSDWVRQIILILLLTGIVELALPSGGMRRYVQVVLGLFVLLTIIRPVLAWLDAEPATLLPAWERALREAGRAGETTGFREELEQTRSRTEELALEVHRQRLASVIREEVLATLGFEPVAIDVDVVSDRRSSRLGAVEGIVVRLPGRLPPGAVNRPQGTVRPVEPVRIGPRAGAPPGDGDTRPVPPAERAAMTERLRRALAARLDVDPALITVLWVETVEGR